jgi:CheY-like chemotaxis protein
MSLRWQNDPTISSWVTEGRMSASTESLPADTTLPARRPLRVLIVEDNRDVADMLQMMIAAWGETVRMAHDALAALTAAAEFKPDVVLLDLGLPRLHGFDVARRLKDQPGGAAVPIIAITGWGQEADRQGSKAAGIQHHLVKPVNPDFLKDLLAGIPAREA